MEWTNVKRGWVYQRKKHLLLSTTWTPKYLVLYSAPIPALAVYEQRSDAMPPYAPLLHMELSEVTVAPAGSLTDKKRWWNHLADGIGSNMVSRKASIISNLSRRGSVRSTHSSSDHSNLNRSYKERILDEQGFIVTRFATAESPEIRLCFATDSREERDSWLTEITRVIDVTNRNNPISSMNTFLPNLPQVAIDESPQYIKRGSLEERCKSEDLSMVFIDSEVGF